MDFAFSEDQRVLGDAVRAVFKDTCGIEDLRESARSPEGRSPSRLRSLCEMGLFGMLVPERAGGLGLSAIDFAPIAEAAGYVALPEPLIDVAGIAAPILAQREPTGAWVRAIVAGGVLAVQAPGGLFLHADLADALLLLSGERLHLVERRDVTLSEVKSVDPLRRLYRAEWTPTDATAIAGDPALYSDLGSLWTAGQLIGLAQRAVDLATGHARQRTQFGRAIGSYQAVKHLLASAQVRIAFARPVYHAAAVELGQGVAGRARLSHARIAAMQAADTAMRASLQVHGAIGLTADAGLHFYMKRTLALRAAWGDQFAHQSTIIDRLGVLPTGPEYTFASVFLAGASPSHAVGDFS